MIEQYITQFLVVVPYLLALNVFLSGLSKALEMIKDKTETKADDKLFALVDKAVGGLGKIVDLVSANRKH